MPKLFFCRSLLSSGPKNIEILEFPKGNAEHAMNFVWPESIAKEKRPSAIELTAWYHSYSMVHLPAFTAFNASSGDERNKL